MLFNHVSDVVSEGIARGKQQHQPTPRTQVDQAQTANKPSYLRENLHHSYRAVRSTNYQQKLQSCTQHRLSTKGLPGNSCTKHTLWMKRSPRTTPQNHTTEPHHRTTPQNHTTEPSDRSVLNRATWDILTVRGDTSGLWRGGRETDERRREKGLQVGQNFSKMHKQVILNCQYKNVAAWSSLKIPNVIPFVILLDSAFFFLRLSYS